MQTAADTSSDARARIPTGCRYKGKSLASDPSSQSDEERLSDQPGAPAGVDEAAAPLNPQPKSPPRLLLVSTPFGYRPSKETAAGIMASYPVLLAQAKQSGYGAVSLIGPAMNTAATRPRMVLPPSWPTDAGEAIRTLEVRIEVLNRAAATHALQHQQDLLEARNGAAADAAQAITLLRFQLDASYPMSAWLSPGALASLTRNPSSASKPWNRSMAASSITPTSCTTAA
jgi:hypothetical protein